MQEPCKNHKNTFARLSELLFRFLSLSFYHYRPRKSQFIKNKSKKSSEKTTKMYCSVSQQIRFKNTEIKLQYVGIQRKMSRQPNWLVFCTCVNSVMSYTRKSLSSTSFIISPQTKVQEKISLKRRKIFLVWIPVSQDKMWKYCIFSNQWARQSYTHVKRLRALRFIRKAT